MRVEIIVDPSRAAAQPLTARLGASPAAAAAAPPAKSRAAKSAYVLARFSSSELKRRYLTSTRPPAVLSPLQEVPPSRPPGTPRAPRTVPVPVPEVVAPEAAVVAEPEAQAVVVRARSGRRRRPSRSMQR